MVTMNKKPPSEGFLMWMTFASRSSIFSAEKMLRSVRRL